MKFQKMIETLQATNKDQFPVEIRRGDKKDAQIITVTFEGNFMSDPSDYQAASFTLQDFGADDWQIRIKEWRSK